ncbi:MAG: cbb3-type cytochrome c oxidase subunit I [Gammaproteobacteria bacterium]|nr:cbb3-type cytochrome c oxidase subunit I [Gammaproteobacteria bacterium]
MKNQSPIEPNSEFNPQIESLLVRAHSLAAFATLLLAVCFGILVSLQFVFPDSMAAFPSWGRLRYAHTQGIMFGWLGNAFIAFMYHAVPVLSGRPVTSRVLGIVLFALWNFAMMIPGWVLVLSGYSQPLEWAEFPLPVDVVVVIAFVLAAVQFLPGFFKRGFENLYVSSWYIIGGLVFTLLSFPMGNIVPELVPGAAGAAFSGLWIHDAVGLFVTPMALAILYYVIPANTGKPIYSHFLSMLGFWGLFFLYPLNGIHHYIYSAIPMAAQLTAIVASFLLAVVVIIVVSNLMLSQRGFGLIPKNVVLRFASMAIVFYLVVSLQGSWQANMTFSSLVHFTDYIIGHSHLAMLGFATFASIAGIVHAWQRLPGFSIDNKILEWSYYLLTIGITLMVVDLSLAGYVQGELWQGPTPWIESVRASAPYWAVRSLSAIPITAGFCLLFYGLLVSKTSTVTADQMDAIASGERHFKNEGMDSAVTSKPSSALSMSYAAAFLGGVGFFVLSVTVLGVLPLQSLNDETALLAPAAPLRLSPAEARGRVIYAREGCSYCHTQQVRFTESDMQRFGAPSLAWEGRLDTPHMLGTRRIGPDLARASGTRTRQWHLVHLFAPRAVVPQSVMPGYPELFDGSADKPNREALDLLAYIETLGRERELAWPEGDERARSLTDDAQLLMSLNAEVLNAHPARTRPRGSAPTLADFAANVSGEQLFLDNCSGCHGTQGLGDGPASAWLQPPPTNFSEHRYRRDLLADILWNGVHGTSMPAWRDLSIAQLSGLADVVQNFSQVDSDSTNLQSTAAQLSSGQQVYSAHCAECHGGSGDGNGFAVDKLPIPVMPTDFIRERLSEEAAMRALREGVPGTSMAPWTDRLSEQEMSAAVHYVRSLYQGNELLTQADESGIRRGIALDD